MSDSAMLTIAQAREKIAKSATAINERETLPLRQAYKRVLAAECRARADSPPADNSAMDGYAIKIPTSAPPWQLQISQTINAGSAPQPLKADTAARIFTGANVPPGADTVVIQEDCEVQGSHVVIKQAPVKYANVRPRGQDFMHEQTLARRGQLLNAAMLGLLAAGGIDEVQAVRAPRVAIVNTGNELVEPGLRLQAGQIYDSNAIMLHALLTGWGCEVTQQVRLPDDLEKTKAALHAVASDVDLIITSGGVSVGDEDHVKAAIAALGQIELWKVFMKPGKPLAFGFVTNGERGRTPVIGLPGNPVSSFVTAVLFVKEFVNGLFGRTYADLQPLYAPAAFSIDTPQKRPELMRVQLRSEGLVAHPNQSSGVLSSVAWADALALIEPNHLPIRPGDAVPYYPLAQLLEL